MSAAKGCETPGRGVSWVGPSVARSIPGSRWWPEAAIASRQPPERCDDHAAVRTAHLFAAMVGTLSAGDSTSAYPLPHKELVERFHIDVEAKGRQRVVARPSSEPGGHALETIRGAHRARSARGTRADPAGLCVRQHRLGSRGRCGPIGRRWNAASTRRCSSGRWPRVRGVRQRSPPRRAPGWSRWRVASPPWATGRPACWPGTPAQAGRDIRVWNTWLAAPSPSCCRAKLRPHKITYYLERRDPIRRWPCSSTSWWRSCANMPTGRRAAYAPSSHTTRSRASRRGSVAPDLPPQPGHHPAISRDASRGTLSAGDSTSEAYPAPTHRGTPLGARS